MDDDDILSISARFRVRGKFTTPLGQPDIPLDAVIAARNYVANVLRTAREVSEDGAEYLELTERDEMALGVRHLMLDGLADQLEIDGEYDGPLDHFPEN